MNRDDGASWMSQKPRDRFKNPIRTQTEEPEWRFSHWEESGRVWCRCCSLPKKQIRGHWRCEHVRRLWKSDTVLTKSMTMEQHPSLNETKSNNTRHIAESLTTTLHHGSYEKSLSLFSANIDDGRAKVIASTLTSNDDISTVALWGNQIGDEGAIAIAQALRINRTITVLMLHDNCIGDRGAAAIAEALRYNRTLQRLTLGHNNITNFGAATIFARALRRNRTLKKLSLTEIKTTCETFNNFIGSLRHCRDIRKIRGRKAVIEKAARLLTQNLLKEDMPAVEQPKVLSWLGREHNLSVMYSFIREKPDYFDLEQNGLTASQCSPQQSVPRKKQTIECHP